MDICIHCLDDVPDTVDHTLFSCLAWKEPRDILFEITGQMSTLEEVIGHILTSPASWNAFNDFADAVITTKEETDRIEDQEKREELLRSSQHTIPVILVDADSELD